MPTSGFGSVQRAYNRFGIATNAMENALRPMTLKFIRTYEVAHIPDLLPHKQDAIHVSIKCRPMSSQTCSRDYLYDL
jgi:hypothetical protein